MLKFYFATVIIYFVIFSACVKLFGKAIRENGWLGGEKGNVSVALVNRVLVAVIPVLRLLLVVGFLVMAATKKEDFK